MGIEDYLEWVVLEYIFCGVEMGNSQLCNGQGQKRSESEVQGEGVMKVEGNSTQPERNRVEIITSCPQLDQKIIDAMTAEKPFQPMFSSQTEKVIYKIGSSIYHGALNDKSLPQGVTKIYGEDGSLGIGEFEDGRQIGQHYLFLPDGSFYFGTIEGEGIGNGSYRANNFQYFGEFQNYQLHGLGKEKHIGYDFQGEYCEGRRVKGKLSWKVNDDNFIYQGSFDYENLFHGEGTLISPEGIFRGNFQNGMKEGKGSFQYSNGLTFEGNYIKGIKNGHGKIVNSNGSICYEGEFKDGLPHGHGRCWDSRGQMREGDFICGISASHFKILESKIQ